MTEREREAERLLLDTRVTLSHAQVFIATRQKMHPAGIALYQQNIRDIDAFLAAKDQPDSLRKRVDENTANLDRIDEQIAQLRELAPNSDAEDAARCGKCRQAAGEVCPLAEWWRDCPRQAARAKGNER
jgi:hypothetical protein